MEIGRRALYNLIRIHAVQGEQGQFELWQCQDYRLFSSEKIFENLRSLGYKLDQAAFLAYAQEYEEPEEFVDDFLDEEDDPSIQDQVYLLFFELWRRYLPEKRALSVFCDEVDYTITQYDQNGGEAITPSAESQKSVVQSEIHRDPQLAIYNLLDQLISLLEEVEENGSDINVAFEAVAQNCANDLETFLYDFFSEQIELGTYNAVEPYLNFFTEVVRGCYWLHFLKVRLIYSSSTKESDKLLQEIFDSFIGVKTQEERDYFADLGIEILYYLVDRESYSLFFKGVSLILRLITIQAQLDELIQLADEVVNQMVLTLPDEKIKHALIQELATLKKLYLQTSKQSSEISQVDPSLQEQICHRLASYNI